jgi:hypothetical protein
MRTTAYGDIITGTKKTATGGGKLSVEAYLQVILKANPFTFQEIQDMRGKTFDEVMEEAGGDGKMGKSGICPR